MDLGFKIGDLVLFNSSVLGGCKELLGIILEVKVDWVRVQWIDNPQPERMPSNWVRKIEDFK